jgi:hypothetical protein
MMFDSPMLDDCRYECVLLEKVRVSDGMGGSKNTWTDGMTFECVFSQDASTQALIAEQEGYKRTYGGYVQKTMELKYHDVFRRAYKQDEDGNRVAADGKIFRVTDDGDDKKSPHTSPLDARYLILERWELPSNE